MGLTRPPDIEHWWASLSDRSTLSVCRSRKLGRTRSSTRPPARTAMGLVRPARAIRQPAPPIVSSHTCPERGSVRIPVVRVELAANVWVRTSRCRGPPPARPDAAGHRRGPISATRVGGVVQTHPAPHRRSSVTPATQSAYMMSKSVFSTVWPRRRSSSAISSALSGGSSRKGPFNMLEATSPPYFSAKSSGNHSSCVFCNHSG